MSGAEREAPAAVAEEKGRVLLALARGSLAEALGLGPALRADEPWLEEPGASFVTLMSAGRLRGCVGSVRAHRPLGLDVQANARAAAFSDTRFPPLAAAELPGIEVEVSVLSPPEPLPVAASEEEALARLRPGVDGLVLEWGAFQSTFLPQVWEQLPAPRDFLRALKHKAGLGEDFWSPEVRLWRYTVTKWSEASS
jgi:AmmeMemoRadiSam system protein A